jgi:hypothetical protein
MGPKDIDSLTELGLRCIYRYFILALSLTLSILLLSIVLYLNQENILGIYTSKFYFVFIFFFLFLIIFIWLIRGLAIIFNGRKEFSTQHESNVIMATLLFIAYLIMFFINLLLAGGFTGGTAFIAAASTGFNTSIMLQFIIVVIFSIILYILVGLGFLYLIQELISDTQIKKLKKALVLFALSTVTFNITGLIAYVLFFMVYRDTYLSLHEGKLKPAVTAPCPNCDSEIPVESQVCPHCKMELKSRKEEENDVKPDPDLPKITV